MNIEKSKFGPHGHLTMIAHTKDPKTGEIKSSETIFDEDNVITNEGLAEAMKRLTFPDGDSNAVDAYVYNIVLGDDVGTGTLLDPQIAVSSLKSTDQSVVYEIPNSDISFTYTTSTELKLGTMLNGTSILDTYFPNDVDMRYTSATIRLKNGKSLSYKRFPVRSLSRLVDIEIIWTLTLEPA